jgi:acetylornithine deacetylase
MTSTGKYIELLLKLLSIPALSREEQERADFLESYLKEQAYSIQRIQNNLLVTIDGTMEGKKILLNSHMDTVAPTSGWKLDPFHPIQKEGKITALGSNDAGASVISLLATFEALVASNSASEVALLISAEEEISGANGMESLLPSLENISLAIVGEPTGMQPAVAERGLIVIDGVAYGKSGHAARNEGVNAIYMVMEDIAQIRKLQFPEKSEWLPEPAVNVTMINAGTNHNVVPDNCSFVIDARSNDLYSNERLLEMINSCCSSSIQPRSLRLNSSSLHSDHPGFDLLKKMKLKPFGSSTMSDMALLPFPAIKMGPGDSARSHTADEYIFITEIEDAITIYTDLVEGLLKSNI